MLMLLRVAGLAVVVCGAPAAGSPEAGECSALEQLYRNAKTDFPALRGVSFDAAKCVQRRNEFRCSWSFPADTYATAQAQAERLRRCTAAQPQALALESRRDRAAFQINPETAVAIDGPEMDSGSWTIRLKIATTADWD